MSVLSVRDLSVSYGGVHALAGVHLEVAEGQLVGLIGPNGAGKTTFIDAITGFTRSTGAIELAGADLTRMPPHARARQGLSRTWQSSELFDDLTVAENLAVAASSHRWWAQIAETLGRPGAAAPPGTDALALLRLESLAGCLASDLSQGQRKLVGVARALAARPRLICLDEPAAGLDTTESQQLGRHLREVVENGTAMLLVDHDMGLVMGICDHVVVLEFGQVIAAGPPERIRTDPAVVAAYLGASSTTEPVEQS